MVNFRSNDAKFGKAPISVVKFMGNGEIWPSGEILLV
jgi:hypothetical protein